MKTLWAIILTPFVWIAMQVVSFIASFPLSWITAKNIVRGKKAKEVVSMVDNPIA